MMKNVVSYVVLGFLVISCGKNTPVGLEDVGVDSKKIIVGDVDWREVTELSSFHPIRKSSKAVADVQFANGGRCTGFLISDNVLMTNNHCIKSASDVLGMKVYMKHEKGVSKSSWAQINCTQYMGTDVTLDFSLVKCSGSPGQTYGKVELDPAEVVAGDDIYVVHQNCDYYTERNCDWSKKYSEGKVVGVETDIEYDADTLGGSSGSPVFSSDSNKVVAIHHAGYGGGWTGRGEKNMGVPMKKIVPVINARFPGVLSADDASDDNDQQEPTPVGDDNETFATATALGSSLSKSSLSISTSKDVDTYKMEMKAGEVMDFEISFSHSKGDLDFKVYKKVGSSVKYVKKRDSSSNDESIKMRVSSSTTYYIQVYGYRGAKNSYDLEFKKY